MARYAFEWSRSNQSKVTLEMTVLLKNKVTYTKGSTAALAGSEYQTAQASVVPV